MSNVDISYGELITIGEYNISRGVTVAAQSALAYAIKYNNNTPGTPLIAISADTFYFSNNLTVGGDVSANSVKSNVLDISGDTTIDGELDVSGDSYLRGNLEINKTGILFSEGDIFRLSHIDCSSDVSYALQQSISGETTINSDNELYFNIGGQKVVKITDRNLRSDFDTLDSILDIKGDISLSGNFDISGNMYTSGTLDVSGDTTMDKTLTVTGDASFNSNVDISGTLDVSGNTTIDKTLTVIGDASFNSNVDVSGNLDVSGNTTIDKTLTLTGNARFNSNVDISGNLDVSSNTTIGKTLTVTKDASFNSNVDVSGTLDVSGDTTIGKTLTVTKDASFNSNVDISGKLDVSGDVIIHGELRLEGKVIAGKTESGNTQVKGTLDVSGDTLVEGTLDVSSNTTMRGTLTVTEDASFNGDVDISGTLDVSGDTTIDKTLTVTEDASFNSNVDISGNLDVSSNTTMGGTLTVKGDVTISSKLNASAIFYIDPAAHGDNTGKVIIRGNLQVDGSMTTINSTVVDISDRILVLASNSNGGSESDNAGIDVSGGGSIKYYIENNGEWKIDSNTEISGNTTMKGTLDVGGATTLSSSLTIKDDNSNEKFKVTNSSGNVTAEGTLDVSGSISCSTVKALGGPGDFTYSGNHENTAFIANNHPNYATSNCSKIVLRQDPGNQYGAEILGGAWSVYRSHLVAPHHLENSQRFAINVLNGGVLADGSSPESDARVTRALSIDKDGIVDIPYLMVGNLNGGTTNTTSELYNVLNSYSATSDDRIKFDEKNVNDCMAVVNELVPFRYNIISKQPDDASGIWMPTDASWNDVSNNFNYKNQYGFIAQDVGDISGLEMLVKGEPLDACGNQTILSLEYNSLFTIGIGAIKELHQLISSQATTISALEARVRILENP